MPLELKIHRIEWHNASVAPNKYMQHTDIDVTMLIQENSTTSMAFHSSHKAKENTQVWKWKILPYMLEAITAGRGHTSVGLKHIGEAY